MALADEIAVKLGLSTAEFKSALKDADASVQGFSEHTQGGLEGLFGSLEHRVLGMRHLSGAIATALGLNLEKIAEHVASVITGISEADKKAYEELSKLSDKATELSLKNMRDRLTEEQKLQLLLTERDRLQKQLDESTAHTAEQLEKQAETRIELETKVSEIQAIQKKEAEEIAKTQAERNRETLEAISKEQDAQRKTFEAYVSTLSVTDKIAALKDDIAIKEAMITKGVLEGKNAEVARASIEKDRNELMKIEAEYGKEGLALDKEILKTGFDKLSLEDKIAALTKERAALLKEMANTEMDVNSYKRDQVRLNEIDKQLAQDTLEITKQREAAEKKVTAEKEKQHTTSQADLDIATRMIMMFGFTVDSNPARQKINEENQRASANESIRREIAALEDDIAKAQGSDAKVAPYIIAQARSREDLLRARLNNDAYVFDPTYTDSLGKGIAATAFNPKDVSAADILSKKLGSIDQNIANLADHVATAFPLN